MFINQFSKPEITLMIFFLLQRIIFFPVLLLDQSRKLPHFISRRKESF